MEAQLPEFRSSGTTGLTFLLPEVGEQFLTFYTVTEKLAGESK